MGCLQTKPERRRQLVVQVGKPIHFGPLERRSFERRAGPRQDTMKRTTAVPSPTPWPSACQVCSLWLACRPSQSEQGNLLSKWANRFTLAHSAHSLGHRSFELRVGPRQDTMQRTTAAPSPTLWPSACQVWSLWLSCRPSQIEQGNRWSKWANRFTLAHLLGVDHLSGTPARHKLR